MRFLIRTLMILSCLAYGYMPAQASLGIAPGPGSEAHLPMTAETGHGSHSPESAMAAASHDMNTGDPCPHRGNIGHAAFCAACVVVVPQTVFAETAKMIYAYPHPDPGVAFVSKALAPPLPPPRA